MAFVVVYYCVTSCVQVGAEGTGAKARDIII